MAEAVAENAPRVANSIFFAISRQAKAGSLRRIFSPGAS